MNFQSFQFSCSECDALLSVPLEMAGITGPCPYCQSQITAPSANWVMQQLSPFGGTSPEVVSQVHARELSGPSWTPPAPYDPYPQFAEVTQAAVGPAPALSGPEATAGHQHRPDGSRWTSATGYPAADGEVVPTHPQMEPSIGARESMANGRPVALYLALVAGAVGLGVCAWFMVRGSSHPISADGSAQQIAPALPVAGQEKPAAASPAPTAVAPAETKPSLEVVQETPPEMPETPASEPPQAPPPSSAETGAAMEIRPAKVVVEDEGANETSAGSQEKTEEKAGVSGATGNDPQPRMVADESLLSEPRQILEQFLAAPNWRKRIAFCQHAELLQPEMENYYRTHADASVKTDSIDYLTSQPTPEGGYRFHLFQVSPTGGTGFPVSVEQTAGGFLVDWRSFVEFKDLLLPKFFEKYTEEIGTFRGVLRRAHYFGTDVPAQERKICFTIEPPVPGYTNHVWLDADNHRLLNKLGERKDWGVESHPVVALRWVKEKNDTAYVTLWDVAADNWRGDPTVASQTR
ncbi:MAG: hypothetical protein KA004_16255 [Verrucomicrobiales bacterium]|nr:hypothetical protein [Verrucomicrobiales bacterium]